MLQVWRSPFQRAGIVAFSTPKSPSELSPQTSSDVLAEIRKRTDTVLLAFSRGKDSIAAWLTLKRHFRVVPFHLATVPGLEFVEDSLCYYENYFGTKIIRLIHPSFWVWLRDGIFQPPHRAEVLSRLRMPAYTMEDVPRILRGDIGCKHAYTAYAMSLNDSIMRRTTIKRRGAINAARQQFYVNHDWKKADVLGAIESAGIKLPVDYQFHRRSFNGIAFRQTVWLKKYFPEDWERLKFWFPLAEVEHRRQEFRRDHVSESI